MQSIVHQFSGGRLKLVKRRMLGGDDYFYNNLQTIPGITGAYIVYRAARPNQPQACQRHAHKMQPRHLAR